MLNILRRDLLCPSGNIVATSRHADLAAATVRWEGAHVQLMTAQTRIKRAKDVLDHR
jgi:hypothetical protein